ncbi:MAG TPA: hypothetical protein VJJ22_03700 [Candidatus Paceibacterota bacterium]
MNCKVAMRITVSRQGGWHRRKKRLRNKATKHIANCQSCKSWQAEMMSAYFRKRHLMPPESGELGVLEKVKALCKYCGGTGVIETGNNDLPCPCPAGDTAKFSVAGEGFLTGAEIKRRDAQSQMPTKTGDRIEYGYLFVWKEDQQAWLSLAGDVVVRPPIGPGTTWEYVDRVAEEEHLVSGHQAEGRVFCIATCLIERNKRDAHL